MRKWFENFEIVRDNMLEYTQGSDLVGEKVVVVGVGAGGVVFLQRSPSFAVVVVLLLLLLSHSDGSGFWCEWK